MTDRLTLVWLPDRLSVCRLEPGDAAPSGAGASFFSITRAGDEVSVVLDERLAPPGCPCESGWLALRIEGTLDFAMVGVLARLTGALAEAGVPCFAISTFDTDYLLVKAADAPAAHAALSAAPGCAVRNAPGV